MLRSLYQFLSPRFQNLFLDYPIKLTPRYGHGLPAHSELNEIIAAGWSGYESIMKEALSHRSVFESFPHFGHEKDKREPAWNNGFLPGLDMVVGYTLLRNLRPKRYVEVGSGNSTKLARRAFNDAGCGTQIISIDPAPRAEINNLADVIIRKPFEETEIETAMNLESGDVLFIDNSHRLLPNSDATVVFLEVLPRLKPGVIVHIHDVYLPYDYPQFMCDRAYSEQYALAIGLLANPGRYRVLFPCFFVSEQRELSSILNPLWEIENLQTVERHGGSFWMLIGD